MRRLWKYSRALCCALLFSAPSYAATVADSFADWSATGTQGEKGWFNGYYNATADANGNYDKGDFEEFTNDGTGDPTTPDGNHWNGTMWDLNNEPTGPWTELGQANSHPNGTNSAPGDEHWSIRRWVSNYAGDASLTSFLAHTNINCGTGTSVQLYHNGTLIDKISNQTNVEKRNTLGRTLAVGDILDLALTPEGIDGDRADGCDSSDFRLLIGDQLPPPPPPAPLPAVADSSDDWSTAGTQGALGWTNGYYNLTLDADGNYSTADFQPFVNDGSGDPNTTPDGNHWSGTQWDLLNQAAGPWTEIGKENTHPNGTNSAPGEEHWTIRRWVASELTQAEDLNVTWQMAKTNLNGTGVSGILMLNGSVIAEEVIEGNDGVGIDKTVVLNIKPNDILELALTPTGPSGDTTDGADGSRNRLSVRRATKPGDYDGNGKYEAFDINGLTNAVRGGYTESRFDLNGDTLVDNADRDTWVNTLAKTYMGDANLDGEFNSGDFVVVFQAGLYEDLSPGNATWETGDWNGNGDFESGDFVAAFAAGGFELGPRAGVSAVPEPSSLVLIATGLLLVVRRRWR